MDDAEHDPAEALRDAMERMRQMMGDEMPLMQTQTLQGLAAELQDCELRRDTAAAEAELVTVEIGLSEVERDRPGITDGWHAYYEARIRALRTKHTALLKLAEAYAALYNTKQERAAMIQGNDPTQLIARILGVDADNQPLDGSTVADDPSDPRGGTPSTDEQ